MYHNKELTSVLKKFFYGTKFNCMSIGALFGFLFAKGSKYLNYFSTDFVAFSSIILTFTLWIIGFKIFAFTDEFYSILFAITIYNIVVNPKINIDNKISRFIGKISYGIYMYHWIIILLVFQFIPISNNNMLLYLIVFGLTIIVSWISYNTIESFFLNIKKRYEIN